MPFSKSSHIYDFLYARIRDYKDQAEQIREWIVERRPSSRTLLDVACGTGLHLYYLRGLYDVAGVDVCPAMVEIARSRNPDTFIAVGDMRSFQLPRRFDVITCLFSSITYSDTVEGLNATLANFARHLNPQGLCIVEPYLPPESWCHVGPVMRTIESEDLKVVVFDRAVRFGNRVRREITYLVESTDRMEEIHEEHVFPLFTRSEYQDAFRRAGFVTELEEPAFAIGRGMYIGRLTGS